MILLTQVCVWLVASLLKLSKLQLSIKHVYFQNNAPWRNPWSMWAKQTVLKSRRAHVFTTFSIIKSTPLFVHLRMAAMIPKFRFWTFLENLVVALCRVRYLTISIWTVLLLQNYVSMWIVHKLLLEPIFSLTRNTWFNWNTATFLVCLVR